MAAVARDLHPVGPRPAGRRLRVVTGSGSGRAAASRATPHGTPAGPRHGVAAVYRRRRLLVAVVALAVAAALGAAVATAAPALGDRVGGPAPASSADPVTVVVGPGETVWDLVLPYVPAGEDPVAYAARVAADNGVDPRAVTAGTVLHLPAEGR